MKNIKELSNKESEKVSGGLRIVGDRRVYLQTTAELEKYSEYIDDSDYDTAYAIIDSGGEYEVNQALANIIIGEHQANRMNRRSEAKDPDYVPRKRKK